MKTAQFVVRCASAHSVRTLFFIAGGLAFAGQALPQQSTGGLKQGDPHKLYLQGERSLSLPYAGTPTAVQAVASGQLKPVALASGDLDGDGVEDLVAGYAGTKGGVLVIHRGNLDAFAPQSPASWQAIGEGRFPSPFLAQAKVVELPESPDFLALGNFTGDGHLDVVVGARGSSTIYILANDGKGGLLAPRAVALSGALTTLATTHFDAGTAYSHIVAGTSAQTGSQLSIFEGTASGVNAIATVGLRAPPTSLAFGSLKGDSFPDVAVVAGGGLQVVRGRDVHAARVGERLASLQAESVAIPFAAASVTVGSFIYDRASRLQMAVLGTDGSVHIITRAGLDTRPWSFAELQSRRRARLNRQPDPLAVAVDPAEGWQVAESFSGVVSAANSNQPPILFRTRISSRGSDDVMVLDSNLAQVHVLSHESPVTSSATASSTAAASLPTSFHSTLAMSASQATVAGISMRVNIDGRPGVVVLKQGQMAPQVMMPLPDPTFYPNRTDDITPRGTGVTCLNTSGVDGSNDCTLREAIIKANATAGTDTIMLQAATYTLSLARNAGDHSTSLQGTLEVQDSLNIIGQVDGGGNPASIIQGGTNLTTSVDKVISFNQDIDSFTDATVSISNLVIQNGHNRGNASIEDGWGGAFDFDTGSSGNSTLTVMNCNITTNTLTEGEGGGFAIFNTNDGTGFAQVSNSTIQSNVTAPSATGTAGNGGGIFIGTPAAMAMSNSRVQNNSANANAGINPYGGGIEIIGPSGTPGQTVIHGSTISGNHAAGQGGGIWNGAGLRVDTSSIISGNSAGTQGGGFYNNELSPDTATLSKVTITGNSATGAGGGISSGDTTPGVTLTVQFSRLAGNTATAGSANLSNIAGIVTATDNWWGTNTPASTIANSSGGATTFDPYIALTNTASPSTIAINQSSTLTGDMSKDNHGNGAALVGNLDVIRGLPITFNNAVLGTIPQAQPESLNSGAQAVATFSAGGVGGNGSADATVDQQTVTADILILAPPSIAKSFNPTTVAVNTPSTVTFSITNGNSAAINGSFTDTLPPNLVVSPTPLVTNTCGGTVTATAGSGVISFSNTASLAVGVCAISVHVQGTTDGVFNNVVVIDSTDAGNGNLSSATLTVINPPSIVKAFGASTIPVNGTTSLTFTVSNPDVNLTLNGVAFTDNFPAGLVVATPPNLTNTCGGTATAVAGASSATLSGSSLAPGASCAVSVSVMGSTLGVKNNSVQVTSTNGGTGTTSNASITVVSPAVIIKSFGAASIPLNGSTSLSFTIQNNNTTQSLSAVAFSDTLPAGLVISTPNGLTGSCGGGTITSTQGTNVVSLSGATLASSTSCNFSVNVTGTAAGQQNNTTGNVTSTQGGTGGTASASVTVVAPPSIAKVFSPTTIPLNGTTTLTFALTNPAANTAAEAGVAFTDALPVGLVVATPNGLTNACNGTVTATAGSGSISLTGGSIAVNASCTVTVNVTGTVSGNYTNTTGAVSSTNGGTGNTATTNLTVASPPAIAKAFGAATIPLNGTTSLTFNITNPNTGVALTGVAFTDNLPAGVVVGTPNNLTSSCGGPVAATPGSGQVSLAAGTLATSASCVVSISIQGTTAGVKNNSVQVTSTEGGTGNTSNASITVVGAPVIIKAFGAASVPLNGSTSLSFTIQNNNATQSLSGVAFSDTLPAGLLISTPNSLTGSCGGGTITSTQGTNVVSLAGATLAQSSSCTFSVNVTGTAAGQQNNTTGNVTSTQGGTGGTASASLNVVAPPSIAKVFNPTAVALNGTTTLTFTITNPAANAVAENGVAFSDTFPVGIVVATPNGLTNTCGGTATATAGSGSVSLTGGTVATSSSCLITVNVTGAVSGNYTNTTGAVSSTNGGTGNTATANLTVASPPVITKTFGVATLPLNGSTSLTFAISNPAANAIALTGVSFTDSLPAGLVVSTPNALVGTCGGGTITAAAGASSVGLAGATLAPSGSCTFSVNVTAVTGGVKNNSVQVTSANGGTGNTSNATLTSTIPPVIIKAFGAASVPLNGSTSLSFTIQNNNATQSLSGVGFADAFPAGIVLSTPNGLVGSCGGGTITATQGTGAVSLSGATLAASSSCTFSANVTGIAAGTQNNTTGNVTSTEGGTGGTASATLVVVAAPSIAKAFTPTAISPNGVSTLSFTITNPAANTAALTGVAFTDTLPAGITVGTPNGLTGNCGGGTITAAAGSGAVSLAGGTIAAAATCNFSVNVTGTNPGVFTNTTGAVSSTNGGTGNTATATLTVATPPSIAKAFGAASLGLAGSTSLTFTITNPNASIAMAGVAFTDALPAGLVVSTPNGLTGTCGSGTVTAAAGSPTVALTGGTIAASGNCSFGVNVTAVGAGNQVNVTSAVTATNGGTGNTATASINVLAPDLTITKSHSGNFYQGETGATYTITANNIGAGPTAGTVTVTDTLPVGLTATGMAGTGWTCNMGTLACTRTDALASGASYPAITLTVSVAANATASLSNFVTVAGGGELNTANDTFTDNTTITTPPDFTVAVTPPSITVTEGQTAKYLITITPVNNAFTNPIALSVSGLPGRSSFAFTSASVTPGSSPATSTVSILTTPGDPFLAQNNAKARLPLYAMYLPFAGLVLSGIGFRKRKRARKWILAIAIFIGSGLTFYGCASAGNFQKLGTPPGTYTITVTATSGSLQHTAPVTLVVQP